MKIRAGLDAPHLPSDHGLRPILSAVLERKGVKKKKVPVPHGGFWDAAHFGLDRVAYYRRLPEKKKRSVLAACSKSLLEEGFFIEKLGLAFTSKMVMLSENTEERMLYSLFASDEATHLHHIGAFLDCASPAVPDNAFLKLLEEVIESGGKPGLTYIIQVVLEGWGVSHYRSIAQGCLDPELHRTLCGIVRDEALHHGSGLTLFEPKGMSESDKKFIIEALVRLFGMVQAGPQMVVGALGPLTRKQRVAAFEELECQTQSRQRLAVLRRLMGGAKSHSIIAALEPFGVFRPLGADECARAAQGGS